MRINGHTRMAAVVAKPIKHSISPLIHNMAFEKTGVNGVYLAWEVEVKDLQASIENIRRYDMFGVNLSKSKFKQEIEKGLAGRKHRYLAEYGLPADFVYNKKDGSSNYLKVFTIKVDQ